MYEQSESKKEKETDAILPYRRTRKPKVSLPAPAPSAPSFLAILPLSPATKGLMNFSAPVEFCPPPRALIIISEKMHADGSLFLANYSAM